MKKHIDYQVTLEEKVSQLNQVKVAELLGITTDAVSKMLLAGREIYLKQVLGEWHYSEFKPWKRGGSPKA